MKNPGVTFDVDGVAHKLRYDFNNVVALEEKLDLSIYQIGAKLGDAPRFGFLLTVLAEGLSRPDLDEEADASAVIEAIGLERAMTLMAQALEMLMTLFGPVASKPAPRKRAAAG